MAQGEIIKRYTAATHTTKRHITEPCEYEQTIGKNAESTHWGMLGNQIKMSLRLKKASKQTNKQKHTNFSLKEEAVSTCGELSTRC